MSESGWACVRCDGKGMYPVENGQAVCDCAAGQRKNDFLNQTDEERRKALREARRKRRTKRGSRPAQRPPRRRSFVAEEWEP